MRTMVAIAGNTFAESIRQPVFIVILALSGMLIVFSPSFAMYTFMESTKLVQDMGLATIMLAGLFLSAFGATTVISREIENRTVLTVLSKPVTRESFLFGKFLGIAAMTTVAVAILTILLMLTFRFGVKDTASTELDWWVLGATVLAVAVTLLSGFLANFFLNRPFVTVAVKTICLLLLVEVVFFSAFDAEYNLTAFGAGLNWQIAIAAFLALLSIWIMSAVAVAASTRLRGVGTLSVVVVLFVAGLVSQYYFGRIAGQHFLAWLAYNAIPNMQVFWIAESMVKGESIPASVVFAACGYAFSYLGATLCLGMLLLSRREVA